MTELDELLLTTAKLHEQATGDLDGDVPLLEHAGLVSNPDDRQVLSFVDDLDLGELGDVVRPTLHTNEATEAVLEADGPRLSATVGVTEQELDASKLDLPLRLLDELENNEAPAFVTGAGNPNTGKTNLMLLLGELYKIRYEDALVIANFDADVVDRRVTSAHDLAVTALEERERRKVVLLDEGSTHMDARTYRREVAEQFTPLAKRFAKLNIDVFGVIVHTGKDLHPEAKRLTTLAYYKLEKTVVDLYSNWDAEADHPEDRIFAGSLEELQAARSDYSPDDSAPWAWDLRAGLFADDLDWSELLDALRERGPVQ